eukprot:8103252-Pyramimonas_sp.AAC.1
MASKPDSGKGAIVERLHEVQLPVGHAQPPQGSQEKLALDRWEGRCEVKEDQGAARALQTDLHGSVVDGEDVAQHGAPADEALLHVGHPRSEYLFPSYPGRPTHQPIISIYYRERARAGRVIHLLSIVSGPNGGLRQADQYPSVELVVAL